MTKLSIIIPIYNASPFLEDVLGRLRDWLAGNQEFELIAVNDGSTDNSLEILESFKDKIPNFQVLSFSENHGKGFALRAGFRSAQGRWVAFTDADLPYGIEILKKMLDYMKKNSDLYLLYGSRSHSLSREKRGYGFLRRLGRSFFSRVIRFLVVPNVLDTQCGIKMLRSELAKQVVAKGVINRFAADIELFIIARANHWRYEDFPVELNHRKESSVRLIRDTLIMFKDVLRIKWNFWRDKYVE